MIIIKIEGMIGQSISKILSTLAETLPYITEDVEFILEENLQLFKLSKVKTW